MQSGMKAAIGMWTLGCEQNQFAEKNEEYI